uniref:Uncharacterized protein n=1 Tax=Oryza meridionalis TaxID=40149 RepID=A0A0E0C5W0_9ORYZ
MACGHKHKLFQDITPYNNQNKYIYTLKHYADPLSASSPSLFNSLSLFFLSHLSLPLSFAIFAGELPISAADPNAGSTPLSSSPHDGADELADGVASLAVRGHNATVPLPLPSSRASAVDPDAGSTPSSSSPHDSADELADGVASLAAAGSPDLVARAKTVVVPLLLPYSQASTSGSSGGGGSGDRTRRRTGLQLRAPRGLEPWLRSSRAQTRRFERFLCKRGIGLRSHGPCCHGYVRPIWSREITSQSNALYMA